MKSNNLLFCCSFPFKEQLDYRFYISTDFTSYLSFTLIGPLYKGLFYHDKNYVIFFHNSDIILVKNMYHGG